MTQAINRRELLRMGAVGASTATVAGMSSLIPWSARAHAENLALTLTTTGGKVTMVDKTQVFMLSYSLSGDVEYPSRTIVCQEGDTLTLTLNNTLGIPVVFALAGTPIRQSIAAGQSKTFSFPAPAAGTYLYHDDQNEGVNRVMGLAGALVCMPRNIDDRPFIGGPKFVRQYKWLFQTVDPSWGRSIERDITAINRIDPDSHMPRYFTINGKCFPDTHHDADSSLAGNYNEAALVRLVNGGGMIHSPHFHGNHVDIITENHVRLAADNRKKKDCVPLPVLQTKEVVFPFEAPPDAWPPIGLGEVHNYPMHDHCEPSQTAGGGSYPYGAHVHIRIGEPPHHEPHL